MDKKYFHFGTGVFNGVAQLADRKNIEDRPGRDPFYSLVPLKEILAELKDVGAGSKRVAGRYAYCINRLGPEMEILLYMKIEELEEEGDIRLSRAVQAMRKRQVRAEPGYDGEYGIVSIHRAAASEPPLFSSLPDAEGGLSAKGESRCLYVSRARFEPAETLAFSSLQGCGLYYPRWR
jgi:hypothetical protein